MKKALVLSLIGLLAFSALAVAGWKFGAEQRVDVQGGNYPLQGYFGYEFEMPYVDTGPISVAGDFVLTRADLWPWGALSGVTWLDAELTFSYLKAIDTILSMGMEFDFAPLPLGVQLLDWYGGIEVIGYINEIFSIFAGVDLQFFPGPMGFATEFYFGFDAVW